MMMCSNLHSAINNLGLVLLLLLLPPAILVPVGVVAAFQSAPPHPCALSRAPPTRLHSSPFRGTGWDNDDFLSSLAGGGGPDADADADNNVGRGEGTELTRSMEAAQRQLLQQQTQQQAALAAATAALGRDQSAAAGYGAGYAQQPQSQSQSQQQQRGGGGGVQKQEVGALPLGWSAHFDPESRQLYYYNVNDGTTSWERPASPPPPPPMGGVPGALGGALGGAAAGGYGGGEDPAGGAAASLPPEEARTADEVPVDESIDGAVLTADMKAQIKASHTADEEASGGGQKFKELLERAQLASAGHQQQVQQRMQQGGSASVSASAQLPPEASDLPIEEQARMYREMMWRQRNPQVEAYPTPQHQMSGIGVDGRKIGRNRDSDMISNEADVYLAQLKRDSTTRNLARYAGDDTRANEVFHDEGIADIRGPEENPYLKERRERERDLVETVPEEMLLFQDYDEQGGSGGQQGQQEQERQGSGVSYRDRLRQIQEERRASQ